MISNSKNCVNPAFYLARQPAAGVEEARALMLARFVEKELPTELATAVEAHLGSCESCQRLASELGADHIVTPTGSILSAVCPSSAALDRFVFRESELSQEDRHRIQDHIRDCSLCRGELDWLRQIEPVAPVTFQTRTQWREPVAIAAAILFFAIASVLWWQHTSRRPPEDQLRALADIKEPHELDYVSLGESSGELPDLAQSSYDGAVNLLRAGQFKAAGHQLQRVLQVSPNHPGALFLLGYTYYQLNQPEKAFELCDKAERIHPHTLERCLSLVHIALKTGHFARAVQEITVLYHGAPDDPEVRDLYHKIQSLTKGRTLNL